MIENQSKVNSKKNGGPFKRFCLQENAMQFESILKLNTFKDFPARLMLSRNAARQPPKYPQQRLVRKTIVLFLN